MPIVDQSQLHIVTYNSQTELSNKNGQLLLNLCFSARNEPFAGGQNISDLNWEMRTESLLYCLYIEKRFDERHGCLFGLILNGQLIAVSGIYRADFNADKIAIAGVRTYTHKDHRKNYWHGDFLLPEQIKWAQMNSIAMLILTFNDTSSALYKFIRRASLGDCSALGSRAPSIYQNLTAHSKKLMIKNVPQSVFKLILDDKFDWDFAHIEV